MSELLRLRRNEVLDCVAEGSCGLDNPKLSAQATEPLDCGWAGHPVAHLVSALLNKHQLHFDLKVNS
jgi:hypothetical protein